MQDAEGKELMDRNANHNPEHQVLEEAVSWFLRIQEGLSQSDFRGWRNWLDESDAHGQAFDSVTAFWRDAEELQDLPWPDDGELVADDYDGDVPLPLGDSSMNDAPATANRRAFLAAAAVTALIGGALYYQAAEIEPMSFETAIAEHKYVELDDGSVITLGGDSQVLVEYDERERSIKLPRGEAYFKVARDASRPFVVTAGNRIVRALGTEFSINVGVRDIRVSVIEGRVRVAGLVPDGGGNPVGQASKSVSDLEKGDVLDFNRAGSIAIVHEVDPVLTTSWVNGRLAYVGATLETVIADLNRYSRTELIIGDAEAGEMIFTGTIFSDDIDNWLQGLERAFPLRVVRVEGYGVLLVRDSDSR